QESVGNFLCVISARSAVRLPEKTAHRRDAENAENAQSAFPADSFKRKVKLNHNRIRFLFESHQACWPYCANRAGRPKLSADHGYSGASRNYMRAVRS